MSELAGFPYFQVQFDKRGAIFDEVEVTALTDAIETGNITDIVFLSHGWKNDTEEAAALYGELMANIRSIMDSSPNLNLPGRKLGFVGLFWPSKKYAPIELQPGGGASVGGRITDDMILAELDSLKELSDAAEVDDMLEQAKGLVIDLEDKKTAQDRFVELVGRILADDSEDEEVNEEVPRALETKPGREIIELLSRPGIGEGRAGPGGAASFGSFLSGVKGGVVNFLNMTTYWKMKKRAGKVGQVGLNTLIKRLNERFPALDVHLVGHSFGGRVVSAAARGQGDVTSIRIKSMSLLQAAFSHYGFAKKFDGDRDGYFRSVIEQGIVSGPIAITHTDNDKAVGMAYPLASRLNRDDSSALGDKDDRFGGIGRNGAQKTAEAVYRELLPTTGTYDFEAGRLYNLNADRFVADHGDVRNKEVANMIVNVIASARSQTADGG